MATTDLGDRRLAAIVFTDVVSFSARMGVNEEETLRLVKRDTDAIRSLAAKARGTMIKSTGDGHLLYFSSASDAVGCALDFLKFAAAQKPPLQYRIGVHLGDVFVRTGDVMGDGVNIAARLQTEAEPGGICMSQTVYDVVKNRLTLTATYIGAKELKNINEPVSMYKLDLGAPIRKAGQPAMRVLRKKPMLIVGAIVLAGMIFTAGYLFLRPPPEPIATPATVPATAPVKDELDALLDAQSALRQKYVAFMKPRLAAYRKDKPLELLPLGTNPGMPRRSSAMSVWMDGSMIMVKSVGGVHPATWENLDPVIGMRLAYTLAEKAPKTDAEAQAIKTSIEEERISARKKN